jgi:hypothetical protein
MGADQGDLRGGSGEDGSGRAVFLDAACGGDAALRAEVERLLEQTGTTRKIPVSLMMRGAPELAAGELVAQYRVERKLG